VPARLLGLVSFSALLLFFAPAAHAEVKAGAAAVDASWHVGASAGQYAGDCVLEPQASCLSVDPSSDTFDPTVHAYRRRPSYGMQSRLSVRAIVIEGPTGERNAIVKNDFYIPQDLVYRRAAQLMEGDDCGIDAEHLTMVSTHNHSSPMYSSSSWGVWAFQDVFDVRFFNYMAERMAAAVRQACDELVPARVGASVGQFDKTHRHSFGPAVADDGTPAGYPNSNTDHDLTVIRFDDISNPADPEPLANLVNWSGHPEFLEGNDLISADYIGHTERIADRETDALTIWTQGAVGTAEPERSTYHSIHERLEFSHKDYAQAEYAARLLGDEIKDTWEEVESGNPEEPGRFVPFDDDFPVKLDDRWFPGPFSHPYPGVSNCRMDKGLEGNPQLPVIGLPDCQGVAGGLGTLTDLIGLPDPGGTIPGIDPGLTTDDFQSLGIPVPENYSAPAYTGLQEDIDVHLQGLRLGDIYLPMCSCEQWFDQSQNIETRTDKIAGNEHLGFDWGEQCDPLPGNEWACPNPNDPSQFLPPVSDHEYRRMRAQVNNAANGWNNAENVLEAESEPVDPNQIKGNYTHDDRCGATPLTPGDEPCGPAETSPSADLGYALTVPIAMANDYNGYIATYREYQRGDHYRKALTGWGPHSSDYMASRLVHIGRRLKNPLVLPPADQAQEAILAVKAELDTAINDQRALALGTIGGTAISAYEAALPDDLDPGATAQPADVERFGASFFSWRGGSNFTDNPRVRVEREISPGQWETYADQSGELPVTLEFPASTDVPSYLTGGAAWEWTAHFEAFVSPFDTGERPLATPPGSYRFVVEGERRDGGGPVAYHLESEAFEVSPWSGITVDDFRLEGDGTMSFAVGPRSSYTVGGPSSDVAVEGAGPEIEAEIGPVDYPDSYESEARFIRNRRTAYRDPGAPGDPAQLEWFCFTCSFRPWVDAGDAETAEVTIIEEASGDTERVSATLSGGRWRTTRTLEGGEVAVVERGAVEDEHGNFNGAASNVLSGGPAPPPPPPGACGTLRTGTGAGEELLGDDASELLLGLDGDDVLDGGGGDDCVHGGGGDDVARGGEGNDQVFGNRGDDRVRGGAGDDYLEPGFGTDVIKGGSGDDVVRSGQRGGDKIDCGSGRDKATLIGRHDRVRRCEKVKRGR
jgi:hypothetical protein